MSSHTLLLAASSLLLAPCSLLLPNSQLVSLLIPTTSTCCFLRYDQEMLDINNNMDTMEAEYVIDLSLFALYIHAGD